jgi:hypothetical protein
MKNLGVYLILTLITLITCSTSAFASSLLNLSVSQELQPTDVNIDRFEITQTSQTQAKDKQGNSIGLGSQATFNLTGFYETKACFIQALVLQILPDKSIPYPTEGGGIHLIGIKKLTPNQPIEISSLPCGGGTGGNFTLPFTVTVYSMDRDGKDKTWIYSLATGIGENLVHSFV